MGNHFGYTIHGPLPNSIELPIRLLKPPSVRREPKFSGNNLRTLYQNPASPPQHRPSLSSVENGINGSATPILPLTPPIGEEDSHGYNDEAVSTLEVTKARSMLATPVNQISPPTPDNTPPREKTRLLYLLGPQPSSTSTRADSFKTAHEDLPSDKESIASLPVSQPDLNQSTHLLPQHLINTVHKPSPLASMPITNGDFTSQESSPVVTSSATIPLLDDQRHNEQASKLGSDSPAIPHENTLSVAEDSCAISNLQHQTLTESARYAEKSRREDPQRGRSLRERLEESRHVPLSPSMDTFANIIGWSNGVQKFANDSRRLSEASDPSAVEAIIIQNPRFRKKRHTLRHVSKNDSLRSTSSPLPNSNRTSMQSSSDSPHRLVHKKAKLSNHNRRSFGSEMSQSVILGSSAFPPLEIIRVAVIPKRSSSLQQSAVSSRRHSRSTSSAPTAFRPHGSIDNLERKRAGAQGKERSRERRYPPQVPARGSSLSAPTSRNTSRANSVTSDVVSIERQRAEKDLRTTLDKMESDRLAASLRSASVDTTPPRQELRNSQASVRRYDFATGTVQYVDKATPGSKEWADLRPTSALHTPFSQPSFMSASPEISEARIISLHPHNNHSVQLIEPFQLQESNAVQEVWKIHPVDDFDFDNMDSPLRNPRRPPAPPDFNVIPATPQDEVISTLAPDRMADQVVLPQQRPITHQRTDSFAKNLLRNVSLKNARNKKADQELDSSLHPFWRPRPFWDGIEGSSPEKKRNQEIEERGVINNSLGLPQQRIVVAGPLGLVRKLSEHRRSRKILNKQSSYSSLQRFRKGRKLYRLHELGLHLQLTSFKDIQDRIVSVRQRKEDEKREKRREALRKSIGPNIVATGDSRFPVGMITNDGL